MTSDDQRRHTFESLMALYRMLKEAETLEHGSNRIAFVEDAVRFSDTINLDTAGFRARLALTESAVFGGSIEKAFVAFSWCVGVLESDLDRYRALDTFRSFLWAYKWIGQHTHAYTTISREQIESTFADMESRYESNQISFRPVYMQRLRGALAMGDGDRENIFRKFKNSERDSFADCAACEQNFEVEYWLAQGTYDQALNAAAPILSGELSCDEVPHITNGLLLIPAALAGDEQAAMFHASGYQLTCDNPDFLPEVAQHLSYVAMHNNVEQIVALMERHLPWAYDSRNDRRRLSFYASTRFACDRLLANGKDEIELQLPNGLAAGQVNDLVSVSILRSYLDYQVSATAHTFDQRNGNTFVSEQLRERELTLTMFAESAD